MNKDNVLDIIKIQHHLDREAFLVLKGGCTKEIKLLTINREDDIIQYILLVDVNKVSLDMDDNTITISKPYWTIPVVDLKGTKTKIETEKISNILRLETPIIWDSTIYMSGEVG